MAATANRTKAEESDLGVCDNHPNTPAVWQSDGVLHSVIRFCKGCLDRYQATRGVTRR